MICTSESEVGIEEGVGKSEYAREIANLCFEDPHCGVQEVNRLKAAERPWLLRAEDVLSK